MKKNIDMKLFPLIVLQMFVVFPFYHHIEHIQELFTYIGSTVSRNTGWLNNLDGSRSGED